MKLTILAVTLLLLSGTAVALDTAVGDARPVLVARIAATTDAREAKQLGKALTLLESYTGENDKSDLKAVTKAVKKIVASGTHDPVVQAQLLQFRVGLSDLAVLRQVATMEAYAGTSTEKDRKKVGKKIFKAEKSQGDAFGQWFQNPGKGAKRFAKSILAFDKAKALAEKLAVPGSSHVRAFVYSGNFWNFTGGDVELLNVLYGVTGRVGGQPFSESGSAASRLPGQFPRRVAHGNAYGVFSFVWESVDALGPEWKADDFLKGEATAVTTAGDFPFEYR